MTSFLASVITAILAVAALCITAAFGAAGIMFLAASLPLPVVAVWKAAGGEAEPR